MIQAKSLMKCEEAPTFVGETARGLAVDMNKWVHGSNETAKAKDVVDYFVNYKRDVDPSHGVHNARLVM